MRRIGIICAMKKEYDLLVREFPEEGEVFCTLSGMGKVNAAAAAQKLVCETKPDCLLSIGVAGTFVDGLTEGTAVIVSRSAFHDVWCGGECAVGQVGGFPLFFESDPELLSIAQESLPDAVTGLLCTGDQFYISQEEDMRQKSLFPDALAVDMEGAAVAQVAYMNSIPFLAVKIISDNHVDGHQIEHYTSFWAEMAEKSFTSIRKILYNLQK